MNHKRRNQRRANSAGRWLAAAVTAMMAVGGCGSSQDPDTVQPSPDTTVLPAAYRDPQVVCASFAADRFGHDTTIDSGPEAAHGRALVWLHPDLHTEPLPGRHPQWATWRAHQAVIDVSLQPWAGDALPADTDETAYRAVLVAATPVGADGWSGPASSHTVYCVLRPSGGGWLVVDYEIDSAGWGG